MHTITARHTLSAILAILLSGRNRVLNQHEREELSGLCDILERGIPGRPIYNHAAGTFSEVLRASGLLETGRTIDIDDLLEKVESMKFIVG